MQYRARQRSSVIVYVARHLAKRAPSDWYSARRSRRPSRPSVTVSPSAPASGLAPRSTLMPGMMPCVLEQLHERRAVGRVLADGLVEEDDAADVVADVLRGEQHLAVVAPVVLGGLDRDRVEALLDRPAALVGGEDALARRDERLGGGGKRGDVHVGAFAPGAFECRLGYRPMPMPWARWSALPSVCSDGATITSAFWNSFSVS